MAEIDKTVKASNVVDVAVAKDLKEAKKEVKEEKKGDKEESKLLKESPVPAAVETPAPAEEARDVDGAAVAPGAARV